MELRPQIIYSDIEPEVSNDVEFDRIQDVLIQGIRDAKYLIWVAVAWFSNEVLYQELLKLHWMRSLLSCLMKMQG